MIKVWLGVVHYSLLTVYTFDPNLTVLTAVICEGLNMILGTCIF
jgi:hypothetical protein